MHLIPLIGGSGSGKGYLAEKIIEMIGAERVATIPMDMYYYPAERFPEHVRVDIDGRSQKNFDSPEALEIPLLIEHIRTLKSGKSVQIPAYDFGNNPTGKGQRTPGAIIEPRDFVILDGIFSLSNPELRDLSDVSIFIDISPLNRLARRLIRDYGYGQARNYVGSGLGDTIKFYLACVERGYEDHVEKYRDFADLIVNNDAWVADGETPKMIDIAVNYLRGKYGTLLNTDSSREK